MKNIRLFSFARMSAMVLKEFIQMRRDRMTFGMMVMLPIMQLILFGYAINSNPKNLPMAVLSADSSPFTRTLVKGFENTSYFAVTKHARSESEAQQLLKQGDVSFVLNIPAHFSRDMVRGKHPTLLLQADGTDPAATSAALAASNAMMSTVFNRNLNGPLRPLQQSALPANLSVHAMYNPGQVTQYNIVPGLLGVVLTMTMVVITSQAITRERERGTMESLLATPLRPLEVMIGKLLPYVVVGYIQMIIIVLTSCFIFKVPLLGHVLTLCLATLPFIAANLAVGLTFSTIAKNQLQAVQATFFFFLPSILLSGFMFPFRGMPLWAQYLGNALPLTHYLKIVRGVMLKGNGWIDIWPALWPILLFMVIAIVIALLRYRQTLD
jgi:ABC-2 type transport system permease protein